MPYVGFPSFYGVSRNGTHKKKSLKGVTFCLEAGKKKLQQIQDSLPLFFLFGIKTFQKSWTHRKKEREREQKKVSPLCIS